MKNPYVVTFTGRKFHFLNPSCDEVYIEDIAHSLSQQARFTGHTRVPYSTAEHSVRVSQLCDTPDMLAGLLHDAGETYLADINRPVKHSCNVEDYRRLEDAIQAFLYKCFGLPLTEKPPSVAAADKLMCGIEARDLMHPSILVEPDWAEYIDPARNHPLSVSKPWDALRAEREFLIRYYQLTYNNGARCAPKERDA